jgi:hypothetical protein
VVCWFVVLLAVNAGVAFLWVFAFGRRYSVRFAGTYFGPGILAGAVMLIFDILLFSLVSRKSR